MARTSHGGRWTHADHTSEQEDDELDVKIPYGLTEKAERQFQRRERRATRVESAYGVMRAIDAGEARARKESA